jgi:hypothetical protein
MTAEPFGVPDSTCRTCGGLGRITKGPAGAGPHPGEVVSTRCPDCPGYPEPVPDDDVIYHGVYRDGNCVILAEAPGEPDSGTEVRHVVKHSPTGLGWGYGGSGPADCARSLLIAALPAAETRCPLCNGTGYTVVTSGPDAACEIRPYDRDRDGLIDEMDPELWGRCWCDGGYRSLPYQQFKWDYVARWPQSPGEWRVRRSEIRAWYEREMYPAAPAGPTSACGACARSGAGVCDDYPNCPAGRRP